MMNRPSWILLLASLAFYCCHSARHTYQPLEPQATESPKMIFLSFSIQADSSGKNIISLISKKEVDGATKVKPQVTASPNHLIISLLDKSGGTKGEEVIEHPLLREVEYTNEKNEFTSKALNLKNAEFFVRMKLPESADRVQVTEVINQKKVNQVEFPLKIK